jgi:endoglucanase
MKLKIHFFVLAALICVVSNAQSLSENIRLDQLGFYPSASKIAIVVGETATDDFFITTADHKDTVYAGKLGEQQQSKNSSLVTHVVDFSTLKKQGTYIVDVPGVGYSYQFKIANNVHHTVGIASLKGFYFQRMSMPLDAKYAGKWARPEGHPDTAVLVHASAATAQRPEGTKILSPGGWYDAGDYNKYVVNSGITIGTLLSAYEDFSSYFDTLKTNIPESSDKVPDLLNEIIYNLRWELTMQDPNDGGVYHKCTNAAFDKMIMPDKATNPRYVVQKSTAATLDFAAVAAQASRVLKKFNKQLPGLSDSCLKAAKYAWQWAIKNPNVIYDQNAMNQKFEPKITTGDYGDRKLSDEWFWASCELYATTKDEQYYKVVSERINDSLLLPSWSDVYILGDYTLIRNEKNLSQHVKDIEVIKKRVVDFAESYLQHVNENAFQTVMGQNKRDFIWGSNAVAMNQSIVLINAYLITKDKKYIDNALTNLDYVLGRNATGYCFVTGIGSKSTMHPHHRLSVADGIDEPVPGLLAGGPNPAMQDKCHYDFIEPETAYSDSDCAYASNEIAINWNAPLVYVANAMEVLQRKL